VRALPVRAVSELPCDQSRIERDSTVEFLLPDIIMLLRHHHASVSDANKTTRHPEPHTAIRRKRKKTKRSQYVITVLDYSIYHVD
jgi:hypothetical protein